MKPLLFAVKFSSLPALAACSSWWTLNCFDATEDLAMRFVHNGPSLFAASDQTCASASIVASNCGKFFFWQGTVLQPAFISALRVKSYQEQTCLMRHQNVPCFAPLLIAAHIPFDNLQARALGLMASPAQFLFCASPATLDQSVYCMWIVQIVKSQFAATEHVLNATTNQHLDEKTQYASRTTQNLRSLLATLRAKLSLAHASSGQPCGAYTSCLNRHGDLRSTAL